MEKIKNQQSKEIWNKKQLFCSGNEFVSDKMNLIDNSANENVWL
jgi:hypothetical protein